LFIYLFTYFHLFIFIYLFLLFIHSLHFTCITNILVLFGLLYFRIFMQPSPRRPCYALHPVRLSVCLTVVCPMPLPFTEHADTHCADVLFNVNGTDVEGRISLRCFAVHSSWYFQ